MASPTVEKMPDVRQLRHEAQNYCRAKPFADMIMTSSILTPQQKRTLRGQALHGDLEGAQKGYDNIVKRR